MTYNLPRKEEAEADQEVILAIIRQRYGDLEAFARAHGWRSVKEAAVFYRAQQAEGK